MKADNYNYIEVLTKEKKKNNLITNLVFYPSALGVAGMITTCYYSVAHQNTVPAIFTGIAATGLMIGGVAIINHNANKNADIDREIFCYKSKYKKYDTEECINCDFYEVDPNNNKKDFVLAKK